MANTLLTNDLITNDAVFQLKPKMPLVRSLDRPYEDMFSKPGLQPGDSHRIRKPVRFVGGDGDDITSSIENLTEEQVTITLEPLVTVGFQATSREFTLEIDQFSDRFVKPAMTHIGAKIESRAMKYALQGTGNRVGTPGTVPTTLTTYLQARQKIVELGAGNRERKLFVTPEMETSIVNAFSTLENPRKSIAMQYLDGYMRRAAGADWFETTAQYTHAVGAFAGTPLVNGASQDGASLITSGWSSGASALAKGDIFTIANVNAVDPQTRVVTGQLQQFVVTTAISDSLGAKTIAISPAIKGPGDQHQNVDALPANNAALTVAGTASTSYPLGLLCAKGAYMAAFVPLEREVEGAVSQMSTDPDTGISVRFTRQWDIKTSKHINRFDVLWGFVTVYPEIACGVWT